MMDQESSWTHSLVFYVNGQRREETAPEPSMSLLEYLRSTLHLKGTKSACGEGGCGVCTVMVSRYHSKRDTVCHYSLNACITPVCSLHGLAVTTVEGIGGSANGRLHLVQEQLVRHHGTQCGFCTPGFVMSMYTLLRNNPAPGHHELHESIRGNLCRCTGYRSILDGFKSLTGDPDYPCPMGEQCCRNEQAEKATTESDPRPTRLPDDPPCHGNSYDATQEPIFPPELLLDRRYDRENLCFKGKDATWLRPASLNQLRECIHKHPAAIIVGGGTISVRRGNSPNDVVYISINHIPGLRDIEHCDHSLKVGGSVTIAELEAYIATECGAHIARTMKAVAEMLKQFGAPQIKNVSTLAGAMAPRSVHSDVIPILLAHQCELKILNPSGETEIIPVMEGLFTASKNPFVGKVVLSISFPLLDENAFVYFVRQAQRRDLDSAVVNAALKVSFDTSNAVHQMDVYYGGVSTTIVRGRCVSSLVGKRLTTSAVQGVIAELETELLALTEAKEASSYKVHLACAVFFKLYLRMADDLGNCSGILEEPLWQYPEKWKSAVVGFPVPETRGTQVFDKKSGQNALDPVGKPVMHSSSKQQATGEARYVDDIPTSESELHVALVTSSKAHARILRVDASECLSQSGVVDFLTEKDIPGNVYIGGKSPDRIFASTEVECVGQVLGAVLATSRECARSAAKMVRVDYEELPAIVSLRHAVDAKSFLFEPVTYERGDVMAGLAGSDDIIEGELEIGGQFHCYLETQSVLCSPKDGNVEMKLTSSTQTPDQVQLHVAGALGINANKVSCRVERLGGAFGGKQQPSQHIATISAVGAYKHKAPVRCVLEWKTDMLFNGGRHPALSRYKVGVNKAGQVQALQLDVYLDGGYMADLSQTVAQYTAFYFNSCYAIPAAVVNVTACKTNLHSKTAFRGFGAPQATLICETWLGHVAEVLKLDPHRMREINFYKQGDEVPFNMVVETETLQRSWQEVQERTDFERTQAMVASFNESNRFKKRGAAICPAKFLLPFTFGAHNQAIALEQIYTDGSVLVTHGGVEMGQGLNIKMIQIAAKVLEVPIDLIHTSEMNTSCVPNATGTCASASSDVNGVAVLNACEILKTRIQPYRDVNPAGTLTAWAKAAYLDRVPLSVTGYYKHTDDLGYSWQTGQGRPYAYMSHSAACSVVEVDVLTGDHVLLRTDIVMDVGQSLNPAVDIGQIEGGFVQGYGYVTTEEVKYDEKGSPQTTGLANYKIPSVSMIPKEFNVSLLEDSYNPTAVFSSKGIGEPPLLLANSVFFAIKDAIKAARTELGLTGYFRLDIPATAERIWHACGGRSQMK